MTSQSQPTGQAASTSTIQQGFDYLDEAVKYSQNHFYSKALNYFDRAEPFFSSPEHLKWQTYIQHEQALVHAAMENYNDAHHSFEQAETGYLALMNFKGTALVMIHRSEAYFKVGNKDEGNQRLRLAEYLINTKNITALRGFLYSSLALYYFNGGFYFEALEYYRQALSEEEEDSYNYAWYQSKLGISYENIFAFDQAEQNLNAAYTRFLKLKCYKELTEVMNRLAKVYDLRGKVEASKDLNYKMLNLNRHFITQKEK